MEEDLAQICRWADKVDCAPVPAEWVPGAEGAERSRLAALGGAIGQGLPDGWQSHLSHLPEVLAWLSYEVDAPMDVVQAAQRILGSDSTHSWTALLYTWAVAPQNRRRLGTFFTASREVDWMLDTWSRLHGAPGSVVDIGAGVGAFTFRAANLWPDTPISAIDVNPVTLGLLAAQSLARFETTRKVQLIQEDFVDWAPTEWSKLPASALLLGNPPYTRMQLLPQADREAWRAVAGHLVGNRASLAAYILALGLTAIRKSDGVCLLLPAQWLESDYASGIRGWLWNATNRRIDLHLFGADLFQGAQVDAVALVVGPEQSQTQPLVASASGLVGNLVYQDEVDRSAAPPHNWRSMFQPARPDDPTSGTSLGQFVVVRRGVATGSNRFFVLDKERVVSLGIDREYLRPLIGRLRDFPGDTITKDQVERVGRYLLTVSAQKLHSPEVERYLMSGQLMGAAESYLSMRRAVWSDLTAEVLIPDVVIGPASKGAFRVIENHAAATITNNLYGLTWRSGLDDSSRALILQWLRSNVGQKSLRRASRTHNGGLQKIEPAALSALPLPESLLKRIVVPTP